MDRRRRRWRRYTAVVGVLAYTRARGEYYYYYYYTRVSARFFFSDFFIYIHTCACVCVDNHLRLPRGNRQQMDT